jgi:putative OmpL-like beta-barrel porin-2
MKPTIMFAKVCANHALTVLFVVFFTESHLQAQVPKSTTEASSTSRKLDNEEKETTTISRLIEELRQMRQVVDRLEKRIDELEAERRSGLTPLATANTKTETIGKVEATAPAATATTEATPPGVVTNAEYVAPAAEHKDTSEAPGQAADDRKVLDFFHGTTFNLMLDGYYGYNFNKPVGRINLLRAYDVLSNSFSLNQATLVIERLPDVQVGNRFGVRVDLQYGQATETLQGNPTNELRPQVYRPVFQAYGTYVLPVGNGVTVDFGKWASSLGIETNYSKDQMNYSRSYFFSFLPFYHFGFRVKYPVNDKLTLMYHVINGVQQSEDFNGFKSQHLALILTPVKSVSWQVNYYEGREGRSVEQVLNPGPPTVPSQPGLSTNVIRRAPGGRLHIVDSYATWNATNKLAFALEGDYVISRATQTAAPSRVTGGAAYARFQFNPQFAMAARAEYLSDRGGLFSTLTQALKETTITADYKVAEGFLLRSEWRRDFSNQRFFLTNTQGTLKKEQNTATLGLIWWIGQKEGSW